MRRALAIVMLWVCLLGLAVGVYWYWFVYRATNNNLNAGGSFAKKLGDVKVNDVKSARVYDLPYLTWGGDVATFIANGGDKTTKKGTLFDLQGVEVNLVNGDDFLGQVKQYLEGETPFLRGTISQMGEASEVLGQDQRTKPIVFLQLTWSQGDHMVARPSVKTLNDLKGKKIALQEDGPHVGMLDDALRSVGLKWSDITVVWTKDVSATDKDPDHNPAAQFRKDSSIDACFVISPDMVDLTGGFSQVGSGDKKTVRGARVLLSTVNMDHSIADVYACRKDYFDKNQAQIEKIAAGYLKASEELIELRKNEESSTKDAAKSRRYDQVCAMTVDILTPAVADRDSAHGLIMDAAFAALPGNYSFFKDPKNSTNFERRAREAVDMAMAQGYASKRFDLSSADLNYSNIKRQGQLTLDVNSEPDNRIARTKGAGGRLDSDIIFSFNVYFDESKVKFDSERYRESFEKAIEQAQLYGSAEIEIRGHADLSNILFLFVEAGKANKTLEIVESPDGKTARYYHIDEQGHRIAEINLDDTREVLRLIGTKDFQLRDPKVDPQKDPQKNVDDLRRYADQRAREVLETLKDIAVRKGVRLNVSQFSTVAIGVAEPAVAHPRTRDEAAQNRRVEFRIYKVSPEDLSHLGFVK